MQGKYLIVDKDLLPPYFEKVTRARELLDEGIAKDVSEAVNMVGISRSTFYKYRDKIRDISTVSMGRHAIITQNPPVDAKANVVITLELGEDAGALDDMIREISNIPGLSKVQLLGMD